MTIRDFPGVDVVDKIVLARDYCVHEWLVTSLNQYARLTRSITMQDVQRLGLNYVLKIAQVREKFIQTPSYPSSSELSQRRKHDFGPALAEMFREEIKRSSIQLTPITPRAVEDFDFVDIFFLVSSILPYQVLHLSSIRLRATSSSRTDNVSKIHQSFVRCSPFQPGRTKFTTVVSNRNLFAFRGSRDPILNPSCI